MVVIISIYLLSKYAESKYYAHTLNIILYLITFSVNTFRKNVTPKHLLIVELTIHFYYYFLC